MNDDKRCARLNEAFQYVEDAYLDIVEQEKRKRKKKPVWLIFSTIAAGICVLLALPVGVMAYNWFGLKDLLLQSGSGDGMGDSYYHAGNSSSDADSESGGSGSSYPDTDSASNGSGSSYPNADGASNGSGSSYPNADSSSGGSDNPYYGNQSAAVISLSGYWGSPEAQALAEWNAFCSHYDIDIGNDVFVAEGRDDWIQYAVNSQEMGEKLDEIAGKYGLKLHREINVVSAEELENRVGGVFLAEDCNKYWGYIYENGAFQCEADVEMEGCGTVDFQFRRSVKGTLDDVVLYLQEVDGYTEWQYITACGEPVLLAADWGKSLIIADFEDCFITVNVLCGSQHGITEEKLRELADKIDFTVLKEVREPEMRGDSVPPRSEAETVEIGQIGKLGTGRLFYTISDQEEEDYKLYFFETQDTDWLFDLSEYPPGEADYVFPDVREGNAAIGRFWQIYFFDMVDITMDGMTDLVIVARYEVEEGVYYDTRIYEWTEEGYVPNYEWMDGMNRKYYNTEEYPVDQIMALPHD